MSDHPLTRYRLGNSPFTDLYPETVGEWVQWAEVEPLLRELEELRADRETNGITEYARDEIYTQLEQAEAERDAARAALRAEPTQDELVFYRCDVCGALMIFAGVHSVCQATPEHWIRMIGRAARPAKGALD